MRMRTGTKIRRLGNPHLAALLVTVGQKSRRFWWAAPFGFTSTCAGFEPSLLGLKARVLLCQIALILNDPFQQIIGSDLLSLFQNIDCRANSALKFFYLVTTTRTLLVRLRFWKFNNLLRRS